MIESYHSKLSIKHQCDLFNVSKSTYYYKPIPENEYNLMLMHEIDKLYLEDPTFGSRSMAINLKKIGLSVGRKRMSRLMKIMCIEAIYPKPKIITTQPGHIKFPYLLDNVLIKKPNQVWGTDITYIPVKGGYFYLVAFMDLYSRYILSWRLSNSLDSSFCLEALECAYKHGSPEIITSDQGVQYTSSAYVDLVKSSGAFISMSGKGRCWDNIFVERFWRTIKYEEVYLKSYTDYHDAYENINAYLKKYNTKRLHSSLKYYTPLEIYLNESLLSI